MVNFSRSTWKNLHRAEQIYTGAACGACDKYQVWTCHHLVTLIMGRGFLTKGHKRGKRTMFPVTYLYAFDAWCLGKIRRGRMQYEWWWHWICQSSSCGLPSGLPTSGLPSSGQSWSGQCWVHQLLGLPTSTITFWCIALCLSWKMGLKVVNFDKLFSHQFSTKIYLTLKDNV